MRGSLVGKEIEAVSTIGPWVYAGTAIAYVEQPTHLIETSNGQRLLIPADFAREVTQ